MQGCGLSHGLKVVIQGSRIILNCINYVIKQDLIFDGFGFMIRDGVQFFSPCICYD